MNLAARDTGLAAKDRSRTEILAFRAEHLTPPKETPMMRSDGEMDDAPL